MTKIFHIERFFSMKLGDDMKKFFALVALLCTLMISSTAMAANWVWVGSDDNVTIYVDNNSICRDYSYSGYVFRAFVKWVYSDEGRNLVIEQWRADGLPRGIYNLSHSIYLSYFKWTDGIKYFDILNAVYYTHDGSIIPKMGYSKDTIKWEVIPPDSIAEAIFDAVYTRVPN